MGGPAGSDNVFLNSAFPFQTFLYTRDTQHALPGDHFAKCKEARGKLRPWFKIRIRRQKRQNNLSSFHWISCFQHFNTCCPHLSLIRSKSNLRPGVPKGIFRIWGHSEIPFLALFLDWQSLFFKVQNKTIEWKWICVHYEKENGQGFVIVEIGGEMRQMERKKEWWRSW